MLLVIDLRLFGGCFHSAVSFLVIVRTEFPMVKLIFLEILKSSYEIGDHYWLGIFRFHTLLYFAQMLGHIRFSIKLLVLVSPKQSICVYFSSSDDYSSVLRLGVAIHIKAVLMVVAPNS